MISLQIDHVVEQSKALYTDIQAVLVPECDGGC